jgi:Phage minor structural protein GP20
MSLKELLGEELLGQVLAKLGETKIGIISDGSYIPKSKFDLKLEEIKGYKEELQARDEQIGQLKESAKGNEELTNKLEQAEKANKEWAGKMVATKKEFQVKLKAAALNAHDADEILAKVNLDSLNLDDNGEVTGLEETLNKIKEDKPYLFKEAEEVKVGGRTPQNLQTPPAPSITKEQFNQMNYAEKTKLYNTDIELYRQLNSN